MKRAEKKIVAEDSIKKLSKPKVAKNFKEKKSPILNSQKINLPKESLKKSLSKTSAKISVPTENKPKNINSNLTIEPAEKSKKKKPVEPKASVKTKITDNKTSSVKISQKPAAKSAKTENARKKSELSVRNEKVSEKNIISKAVKADPKAVKKDSKTVEKVEIEIPAPTPKIIKKKLKPIGSAVVRGRNGRYDFEVFPLDAELKDGSAIYLISKRITDKQGRGHHKFVCIGQTESLLGDLKRHKKDRCIKEHKANVVCLLREDNEKSRLKIETDLREAHTIFCNQK